MGKALVAAMAAVLAGGLAACNTETTLTIRAQGENSEGQTVPLSNVALEIIPYDIDLLYGELEQESRPGIPPPIDTLSMLAQQYQDLCTAYRSTGDSIETVRQQAIGIARNQGESSEAYKQAFEQYQALLEREKERFNECQELTDRYTVARNTYREARRGWEAKAWPEEALSRAESLRAGELPIQRIETDADGMASLTVPNGTWWILGSAPVPGSISQRYRWNERIEAGGGEQIVELTSENATLEPVF